MALDLDLLLYHEQQKLGLGLDQDLALDLYLEMKPLQIVGLKGGAAANPSGAGGAGSMVQLPVRAIVASSVTDAAGSSTFLGSAAAGYATVA